MTTMTAPEPVMLAIATEDDVLATISAADLIDALHIAAEQLDMKQRDDETAAAYGYDTAEDAHATRDRLLTALRAVAHYRSDDLPAAVEAGLPIVSREYLDAVTIGATIADKDGDLFTRTSRDEWRVASESTVIASQVLDTDTLATDEFLPARLASADECEAAGIDPGHRF